MLLAETSSRVDVNRDQQQLVKSISAIMFLGTPHRGSRQAKKINRILALTGRGGNHKAYIRDLTMESAFLQRLNDEFRGLADRLQLFCFYETKKTQIGLTKMVSLATSRIHNATVFPQTAIDVQPPIDIVSFLSR